MSGADRASDVQSVDPTGDSNWDSALSQLPADSLFYRAAWARTLKSAYGYAPRYLALRDKGRIQGLLPLIEVTSWLTGRRAVSLPFTDECVPAVQEAAMLPRLHAHAVELGRRRRWKYLEYRGGRSFFPDAPASQTFHGHRLDLTGGEDACHKRLTKATRGSVKKAESSGVEVEFSSSPEAIREFYALVCKTRRRLGVPPQPFSFFTSVHRHLLSAGLGTVALARYQDQAVAGAVYFHAGRTVVYKYSASDEAFRHVCPNNLVKWRAIQRFSRLGFANMDFGRTDVDNEGLRRYKLGWGVEEYAIEYLRFDLRTHRFVAPKPHASGAWQSQLFRKLPEPALRLVGALLYKHIA